MLEIKDYEEKYVEQISALIIQNIININSKDYGMERAKKIAQDFTVEKLKNTLSNRKKVYVSLIDNKVVGTAGLDKSWDSDDEYWILSVFVKPENHGQGIGTKLIRKIEEFASTMPIKKLIIPASITAHEFYYKLGYRYKDGKKELNDEDMYIMEKSL